jgi:c-di-GMP-related signal transduction protein
MTAQVMPAQSPEIALPEMASAVRYLARAGPEAAFRGDGDVATRTMLDNSVIFGLEKLTARLTAFVNCTSEALTEQLVDVLPASMTVLEILETLEPPPSLITACRKHNARHKMCASCDYPRPGL